MNKWGSKTKKKQLVALGEMGGGMGKIGKGYEEIQTSSYERNNNKKTTEVSKYILLVRDADKSRK